MKRKAVKPCALVEAGAFYRIVCLAPDGLIGVWQKHVRLKELLPKAMEEYRRSRSPQLEQ